MNKSILEIAEARSLSYTEAEEFCRAVYRHFVGVVPRYEVLAQAVNDAPAASPTTIADKIALDRTRARPKQVEPGQSKHSERPPAEQLAKPARKYVDRPTPKKSKPLSSKPATKSPARVTAKSSVRNAPKQNTQLPERSALKQEPIQPSSQVRREQVHLRSIAKLRKLSLTESREYVFRIQHLCVEKPPYSAIAAACKQLAYERHTDSDIAARASMIQGWSQNNVRLGSDERRVGLDRPTVQPAQAKPPTPKHVESPARSPDSPSPVNSAKSPAFTKATYQGSDQFASKLPAQRGGGRPSYSSSDGSGQEPMRTDANSRLPKNPLRSENRIDPGTSPTCPHDIPIYKKCYICQPDNYDK